MRKLIAVLVAILAISSSANCADFASQIDEAKSLVKSGDLDGATSFCTNIINAHPGAPFEPRARVILGYILTKKKAPAADIINQFAQAANQFPSSPEAPEALLRIGYLRDRDKTNPAEWQQLVDKYPDTKEAALAFNKLGFLALRDGNPELAVDRFNKSAAVKEADLACAEESQVEAGYAYISCYWKTPDPAAINDAISHLTALKARNLTSRSAARVRLALGESYLILERPADAAKEYQEVLDLHPNDPYLYAIAKFELGASLYAKCDWEGALSAFDSFLSACAGSTLVERDKLWRSNRPGYAKLVVREPQKAEKLTGLDLVPQAAYWKAETLRRLKRYSEARALADEVVAGFPGFSKRSKAQGLSEWCAGLEEDKQ